MAFGQCYSTSRVVQRFYPEVEIVEGKVWTGKGTEKHFWNALRSGGSLYHLDLTWQQFPSGSIVKEWWVRDRETLGDSQRTIDRIELLYSRVNQYISSVQ